MSPRKSDGVIRNIQIKCTIRNNMCEEKLLRKKNRLATQTKRKVSKTSGTLAAQQQIATVNKRYKNSTKIKVTVNL